MPQFHNPLTTEECPECETDLILMQYQGIQGGCPECIPSGLVEQYAIEEVENAG